MVFGAFRISDNHSCDLNAWWVYEGKELRVRAAMDISPNQELTFTYVGDRGHYGKRRDQLETNWGIWCTCILCNKGNTSPISNALRKILRKIDFKHFQSDKSTVEFEQGISGMLQKGHTYQDHPMWALHQQLVVKYSSKGDVGPALQTLLKIRYLIEPNQDPSIGAKDRLSTLFNIIALMTLPLRNTTSLILKIQPKHIIDLNEHLLLNLKYQYMEEVRKFSAKLNSEQLPTRITQYYDHATTASKPGLNHNGKP
jgi:hypothetical protein